MLLFSGVLTPHALPLFAFIQAWDCHMGILAHSYTQGRAGRYDNIESCLWLPASFSSFLHRILLLVNFHHSLSEWQVDLTNHSEIWTLWRKRSSYLIIHYDAVVLMIVIKIYLSMGVFWGHLLRSCDRTLSQLKNVHEHNCGKQLGNSGQNKPSVFRVKLRKSHYLLKCT